MNDKIDTSSQAVDALVDELRDADPTLSHFHYYKVRDQAADTLSALSAKVEQLQSYIDDNSAQTVHSCHEGCQRVECRQRREIDDLRASLEQFETTALEHMHGASVEITNLKTQLAAERNLRHAATANHEQQLTAAQARVQEMEQSLASEAFTSNTAILALQARESRLRESVTKAEDYVFALVNPDNPRNGTVLAALAALRAALAQSQGQDGGAK